MYETFPSDEAAGVASRLDMVSFLNTAAGRHRGERDRVSRPATHRREDRGSGNPGREVAAWQKDGDAAKAKVGWRS